MAYHAQNVPTEIAESLASTAEGGVDWRIYFPLSTTWRMVWVLLVNKILRLDVMTLPRFFWDARCAHEQRFVFVASI